MGISEGRLPLKVVASLLGMQWGRCDPSNHICRFWDQKQVLVPGCFYLVTKQVKRLFLVCDDERKSLEERKVDL